jgi:putative membrane protein
LSTKTATTTTAEPLSVRVKKIVPATENIPSGFISSSGSTARDILATERTFLAWNTTGQAFLASGAGIFAAYSVTDFSDDLVPASLALCANGAALMMFAVYRYQVVVGALLKGIFPVGKSGVIAMSVATFVNSSIALYAVTKAEFTRSNLPTTDASILARRATIREGAKDAVVEVRTPEGTTPQTPPKERPLQQKKS